MSVTSKIFTSKQSNFNANRLLGLSIGLIAPGPIRYRSFPLLSFSIPQ
jgi:hypothetical protein